MTEEELAQAVAEADLPALVAEIHDARRWARYWRRCYVARVAQEAPTCVIYDEGEPEWLTETEQGGGEGS